MRKILAPCRRCLFMHPQRSSIEIYLRSEVPRHVAILMNGRGVGPIGIYLQIFAPKLFSSFFTPYPHLNDGKGPIQGQSGQLFVRHKWEPDQNMRTTLWLLGCKVFSLHPYQGKGRPIDSIHTWNCHGGHLICPPQMGAWPKYANNVLCPGLEIF